MHDLELPTGRRGPGRPRGPHVAPWPGARVRPGGSWRSGRGWMARGACTAPDVDSDWFTVEETAPGAVYAGETHTERTRRLRRWQRLELPA